MTQATLMSVPIEAIDHNPFRDTGAYPFIARKVEALKRSIHDVGMWEGIIARKVENRYQIAFGHHRVKAAEEAGLTEVPVIARDLTDKQMLSFMGRENMEDYNADFLIMLETWEAAWSWTQTSSRDVYSPQAIDVAKLLGWDMPRSGPQRGDQMNRTADACNSARKLLAEKLIDRADLVDMTVNEAREVLTRASANVARIEKAGKALGTPAAHIDASKKAIGQAVKTTAAESRRGVVPQNQLRGRLDSNAYKHARSSKVKNTPLFAIFAQALANSIAKLLSQDALSDKLEDVMRAMNGLQAEDDVALLRRIGYELGELETRASSYKRKLTISGPRVVPLTQIGEAS